MTEELRGILGKDSTGHDCTDHLKGRPVSDEAVDGPV